ncbi:HAD hydrolase-like protein [Nocardia vinacea]|uniref:HAD family hydrolase n=1 Tax=Nocardia vinacea TaxID=96468 RepID=UPI0033C7FF16
MKGFNDFRVVRIMQNGRDVLVDAAVRRIGTLGMQYRDVSTRLRHAASAESRADRTGAERLYGPPPSEYSTAQGGIHAAGSITTSSDQSLRKIVEKCRIYLFDFDGPICSVFGNLRDHEVAELLRRSLGLSFPQSIATANDPFVVFRYAALFGGPTARKAERELARLEVEAVRSAPPTAAAHELIRLITDRSGTVAIVSNNSGDAVHRYLTDHDLGGRVAGNYSRGVLPGTAHYLSRLKPDRFPLERAMAGLGVGPDECVYVGDSVTDIQAAHAAGMPVVALADKPGKDEAFAPHSPEVTISTMEPLLRAAQLWLR